MNSDVEEPDRQQDFVLFKGANIQFLSHGHDQVTIEVTDVTND